MYEDSVIGDSKLKLIYCMYISTTDFTKVLEHIIVTFMPYMSIVEILVVVLLKSSKH